MARMHFTSKLLLNSHCAHEAHTPAMYTAHIKRPVPHAPAVTHMLCGTKRRRCRLLRTHFELPWQVADICLLHELGMQPFVHTYVLLGIKLYNS